jgi:hypothetical protein
MGRVLARRISIAVSALILLIVIAASVADRQAQESRATAPPPTVQTAPPAPVVRGNLPGDKTITARVGDVVSVAVRTEAPDDATIAELGINAPTSSDVPGVLEFVAAEAGSYDVVLTSTDKPVGTVVVEPAGS